MGLLDALLPPDHRDVAMRLKNYAVSKTLAAKERQVLENLQVGEDIFVRERVLFLCSFIRACLIHLGDDKSNQTIGIIRHYYDIYVQEHFKTQPGIDSKDGLQAYEDALKRYGLREKEVMYPAFLERLKYDASLDAIKAFDKAWVSPSQYALFSSLVDSYTKSTIDLIRKQAARAPK